MEQIADGVQQDVAAEPDVDELLEGLRASADLSRERVRKVLEETRWHYEKLGPGMVAHAFFNAVVVVVVVSLA